MSSTLPTLTDADVRQFTRQIDSLVLSAVDVPEMYLKLGRLEKNGSKNWQLLRSPCWQAGRVIAVLVKPRTD